MKPPLRLDQFGVADLESVRIVLRGDSVIDWHRLNFFSRAEVESFILANGFNIRDIKDRARMENIKQEAVSFLVRRFDYPIPNPVASASVEELLEMASARGHRQTCACTILKCMHIIHHVEGRELLFMLPFSNQEIFHLVEEKVYRTIGEMLASGFPVIEIVGGRKQKDSLYTKLLSKQETIASQIYDKLRFRIVVKHEDDIFPVLQRMSSSLFPFNYVIPGQSINSIIDFRAYCKKHPNLATMMDQMQAGKDWDFTLGDNVFSSKRYRVIHFVVDMPVRLPDHVVQLAKPRAQSLGPIVFVICEFQLVDREAERMNELGDASHSKYKERQKKAVMRRLQVGMKEVNSLGPPQLEQHGDAANENESRSLYDVVTESELPPKGN